MVLISMIIIGVFVLLLGAFILKDVLVAKRAKVKMVHYTVRGTVGAYLMLLPALALLCIFVLLPIVYSLGYAFTDYYLLRPDEVQFIGFGNFADIFEDIAARGNVYNAIMKTLKFVVFVVPLQIGMALGLALPFWASLAVLGVFLPLGLLGIQKVRSFDRYREVNQQLLFQMLHQMDEAKTAPQMVSRKAISTDTAISEGTSTSSRFFFEPLTVSSVPS